MVDLTNTAFTLGGSTLTLMGLDGLGQSVRSAGTVYGAINDVATADIEMMKAMTTGDQLPTKQQIQSALGYSKELIQRLDKLAKNGAQFGRCIECEGIPLNQTCQRMKKYLTHLERELALIDASVEELAALKSLATEKAKSVITGRDNLELLIKSGGFGIFGSGPVLDLIRLHNSLPSIAGALSSVSRSADAAIKRLTRDRAELAQGIENLRFNIQHNCPP